MTQRTPIAISASATPAAKRARSAVTRAAADRRCAPRGGSSSRTRARARCACSDLARSEEAAVRQHDAARVSAPLAADRLLLPASRPSRGARRGRRCARSASRARAARSRPSARRGRTSRGIVGADQATTVVPAGSPVRCADRDSATTARASARAPGSRGYTLGIARGLTDDEHARVGSGVASSAAEDRRAQLAQQLGADRPGPRVASRRECPCRAAPTGSRRSRRRARAACRSCRRRRAPSPRDQQLEERRARSACPGFDRWRAFATSSRIRARPASSARATSLRARLRVQRCSRSPASPFALVARHRGDEVVVGAAIAVVERTRERPRRLAAPCRHHVARRVRPAPASAAPATPRWRGPGTARSGAGGR